MKESLVLGILFLTGTAVSSYGEGCIFLDNYALSTSNPVCLPAEFGGGPAPAGFTAGLYYDPTPNQNIVGAIAFDPTGYADPSALNSALVPATGLGSTASIFNFAPGYFEATASFLIQPNSAMPPQNSYTVMVVMYNGSSYETSTIRGHSAPVYIEDASPVIPLGADIGTFFPANTPMIGVVPEPATLALAGLGGLSLALLSRKGK